MLKITKDSDFLCAVATKWQQGRIWLCAGWHMKYMPLDTYAVVCTSTD